MQGFAGSHIKPSAQEKGILSKKSDVMGHVDGRTGCATMAADQANTVDGQNPAGRHITNSKPGSSGSIVCVLVLIQSFQPYDAQTLQQQKASLHEYVCGFKQRNPIPSEMLIPTTAVTI